MPAPTSSSDRVLGAERAEEHVDRGRIRRGQVRRERARDVLAAIEELERLESSARLSDKLLHGKARMRALDIAGEPANELRREK